MRNSAFHVSLFLQCHLFLAHLQRRCSFYIQLCCFGILSFGRARPRSRKDSNPTPVFASLPQKSCDCRRPDSGDFLFQNSAVSFFGLPLICKSTHPPTAAGALYSGTFGLETDTVGARAPRLSTGIWRWYTSDVNLRYQWMKLF